MQHNEYPSTWARSERTRDGTQIHIRPIRGNDIERERQFINTLSEQSRYERFLHALRDPSRGFLQQMVNVDYRRSMAFVATVGESSVEKIIGVARYAATDKPGADCEFAVAVADEWQLRGVGTILMHLLLDYARAQGFCHTHADILAENTHMIQLAHDLGFKMHPDPDDKSIVVALGKLR